MLNFAKVEILEWCIIHIEQLSKFNSKEKSELQVKVTKIAKYKRPYIELLKG